MSQPLRLVLVLHNHQPIGNFDGVCEQAYQDSYLPFLDVFEEYHGLPIGLHTSGSLIEWLEKHRPEYLHRLATLVNAGRIEVLGGPFYEPILTMIPSRDRVGQIRAYTQWLEDRLGANVRGMWMPERVWEQSLTRDLVEAGMEYTILDDFHFKNAGWTEEQLHGYYLTEEDTRLLSVFPGSERLRYTIPFAEPHETIEYLHQIHERQPGAVVLFGDDGEKLGTWPDTHDHVYKHGWLRRFFEALQENSDWLKVTTPAEALDSIGPLGNLYIPECSYREMTEWALPAAQQNRYHDLQHDLQDAGKWEGVSQFARGGFWRNFKVRYPETGDMYARMQMISKRIAAADADAAQTAANRCDGSEPDSLLEAARTELYRGQCNCSYWHGAFGGVYLPHLRHAVYNHLIAADNLLDQRDGRGVHQDAWVSLDTADYNLDARQEVRLASNRLVALVAPSSGAELYELDIRSICLNAGATLARREEAYHRKVLAGPPSGDGDVASIHDRVVFKQEGLDQMLQYDDRCRHSLVDHFYDLDVSRDAIARSEAREAGDFVGAAYETKLRRKPDRMQAQFFREGHVDGHPIRLTKGVTLDAGCATLEVSYLLEDLPTDRPLHFSTEFNLAGLPAGADDRFFHLGDGQSLAQLGEPRDLHDLEELHLMDEWLGLDMGLTSDRPTSIWTYPISTVSQSEGGFELVNQSIVVQPHWILQGDHQGRWHVTLRLTADTSAAEGRSVEHAAGEMASV